jgi:hypothetical protein
MYQNSLRSGAWPDTSSTCLWLDENYMEELHSLNDSLSYTTHRYLKLDF